MIIFLVKILFSILAGFGPVAKALIEQAMVIVIMLAGIVMIFGAVGLKISNNLGSTVVNGLFKGIGYIGRQFFRGIAWIAQRIWSLIPRIFRGSRNMLSALPSVWANILAVLITLVVIAIII